ncbi:hypothetical protein ABZ249_29465 [Nocardiopsis sp. NPDC006139]|uniref:hypothetical protein n=1 Tax=Nocardiopsis TaxID=2013 RepID=UPI0033BADF2E
MSPHTSETITQHEPAPTAPPEPAPLTPQELVPHLRDLARSLRERAADRRSS